MTRVGSRVRVLVVDDSSVQRQLLCRLLSQDPEIEVVGSAGNGAEALRAVSRLRPDIVTLDERMPIMGGLETARHIMCDTPTPIVMISSATGAEAQSLHAEALLAGVLAIQDKRALGSAGSNALGDLVRLIKGMSSVRLVRRRHDLAALADSSGVRTSTIPRAPEIVVIGASTGGPQALRAIISCLPANFPLPILVVQHTTAGYSNNLVDWLQTGTRLTVRVAENGRPVGRTGVYIAPTERHLIVHGGYMTLLDGPPVSLHRPSATVLFRSVAATFGARSVGILLTGMGDDGAAGLMDMKRAGGLTIAQDEKSCVVFGMPAEAIRLGAADHVLPPNRIVELLVEHATGKQQAA